MEINLEAATSALDELIASNRAKHETRAIVQRKVNTFSKPITLKKDIRRDELVAFFLNVANTERLVECKPVKATGTGATTIFVRNMQTSPGGSSSASSLPFKAWMTKTSICAEPFVIFHVPLDKIRQQQRILGYLAQNKAAPFTAVPVINVTLLTDQPAMNHPQSSCQLEVSFSTSADLNQPFRALGTFSPTTAAGNITQLSVAVSDLQLCAKISIRAVVPGVAVVKVSAICVSIGVSEPSPADILPATFRHDPLFAPARKAPSPYDNASISSAAISTVQSASESGFSSAASKRTLPRKKSRSQHSVTGARTVPPKAASLNLTAGINMSHDSPPSYSQPDDDRENSAPLRTVAAAMREKAAFILENFPETIAPQPKHISHVCDWLKEETFVSNSSLTAATNASTHSSRVSINSVDVRRQAGERAFAQLIEAWEVSSTRSLTEGLLFCMRQVTSFSCVIAEASNLQGVTSALSSSFPFNLLHVIFDPAADAAAVPSSPLEMLMVMMGCCQQFGYALELVFRTSKGFCVTVTTQQSLFGNGAPSKKYILANIGDRADFSSVLSQTSSLFASEMTKKLATLRVVLDLANSLSVVMTGLTLWSQVGAIRYYGAEGQSNMAKFLSHSCVTDTPSPSRLGPQRAICHNNYLVSAVRIAVESDYINAQPFLSLALSHVESRFLVWQPHQQSPRVILTNCHLLGHLRDLDGALVFDEMRALAKQLLGSQDGWQDSSKSIIPLADNPWRELADRRAGQLPAEANGSWMEARRQTTTKFIFHVLSTAFRHNWSSVGICLPYICSAAGEHNCGTASAQHLLDQDAVMDTVLRWSYPAPTSVVFFYGHDRSRCAAVAAQQQYPPFNEEALSCFVPTQTMAEALE